MTVPRAVLSVQPMIYDLRMRHAYSYSYIRVNDLFIEKVLISAALV